MNSKLNVVTGATGLLGSHVVEQLRARGETVRALVRPTSDTSFLKQCGVELVQGDVQDAESLRRALAGADIVYHCAARVGDWGSWAAFKAQVIDATGNVVEACRSVGVRRLLHVSSISVYGHPRGKEVITEDEPWGQHLRLLDHYCRAKMQAEELAWKFGLGVTVVRPSWIYGPRDRNGFPRLVKAATGRWIKIIGPGDNPLNIAYVGDVADGAIRAANEPAAQGRAYHLCSEGEITQKDFLDTLCDLLQRPRITRHISRPMAYVGGWLGDLIARAIFLRRPPHISRYSVALMIRPANYSNERAKRELGWQPHVHPTEGLRRTMEWYREYEASVGT